MAGPKKKPSTKGFASGERLTRNLSQIINLKKLRTPYIQETRLGGFANSERLTRMITPPKKVTEFNVKKLRLPHVQKVQNLPKGRFNVKATGLGRAAGPLGTLASFAVVAQKVFNIYTKTKKARKTWGPALKQLKKDYKRKGNK